MASSRLAQVHSPDNSRSLSLSLNSYPIRRGLAEELGAVDRLGRGFSLDHRDVGLKVDERVLGDPEGQEGHSRRDPLPEGHRYFPDCERECWARLIAWSMRAGGVQSWFVTLTFQEFKCVDQAHRLLTAWLCRAQDAYKSQTGAYGLRWIAAQEWQKRGVIHFHLILSGVRLDELSRKRWEHRWEGIGGGYARIYPAREKAAPYLAKYMSKSLGGAVRQGGNWRGIVPPKSARCCKA